MRFQTKSSLLLCFFVALVGLVGCSDDDEKKGSADDADVAVVEDVGTGDDSGTQDTTPQPDDQDVVEPEVDVDGSDTDVVEPDLDAGEGDESDADVVDSDVEPDMDADDGGQDTDVVDPVILDGETCANALDVTAGGTFEDQTTVGYADSYDAGGADGCNAAEVSGGDRVYVVSPAVDTEYKVTVRPKGDYNPMIYARTDCDSRYCVAGVESAGAGEVEEVTLLALGGKSTFIVVDGELTDGSSEGEFTLELEILKETPIEPEPDPNPMSGGETCEEAVDVTGGGLFVEQTTIGYEDTYTVAFGSNCPVPNLTGADRVYSVKPTLATKYKFTVTPQAGTLYNPMIYTRSECSTNICLDGANMNGPGVKESLVVSAAAGEQVFFIVDGDFTSGQHRGNFDLNVEVLEETVEPDPDPEPEPNPMTGGETCADAIDVTAGGNFENHTTVGAGEDYDLSFNDVGCPGGRFSGPDRVYSVTPTVATEYRVTVRPKGNYNPLLYMKADCDLNVCIGGKGAMGAGRTISATFQAAAGVPSFIIVDGMTAAGASDKGEYDLDIEILP